MGKKPESEVDDVDDMLNALEVSKPRERARRAPDLTPAPEAIAKAQRQSQPEHRDRKPFAGTIPMAGAPQLPGDKKAPNPQLVTDPLEREFLNRPQERARPRRRNEPTMMTGPREEPAPTGSYIKAALITFAAVLAVGLIAWRIMGYIAAQAPAHVEPQDPHIVSNANASETASVNPRIVVPPPPALTDMAVTTSVPSTASTAQTTANQAPNVIATSRPADTAPRASAASVKSAPTSSNGKGPASKYGGMIDPTAP